MPIALGVGTFACSRVPVGVGVLTVSGSMLPTCSSFFIGLLGDVGYLVAPRGSIISERGSVVTPFR